MRSKPVRGDLNGATLAYDCRTCMRLLHRTLLASGKDRKQLVILTFWTVATTLIGF